MISNILPNKSPKCQSGVNQSSDCSVLEGKRHAKVATLSGPATLSLETKSMKALKTLEDVKRNIRPQELKRQNTEKQIYCKNPRIKVFIRNTTRNSHKNHGEHIETVRRRRIITTDKIDPVTLFSRARCSVILTYLYNNVYKLKLVII